MHSTYINDMQDVAYPLLGDAKRPFPDSVLVGMGICVHSSLSAQVQPIAVTQLVITALSVTVTLAAGNESVGTFTAYPARSSYARLVPDNAKYSGFLCVGSIPETCYGTYSGLFRVDPSCIHYDTVTDTYGLVTVDGSATEPGPVLGIKALGDITLTGGSGGTYTMHCSGMSPRTFNAYSKAETVNGVEGCTTLSISVSDTSSPRLVSPLYVRYNDSTITVAIEGTGKFPSCFGSEDEAGEWQNDENRRKGTI